MIKRTTEYQYHTLIDLVRQLAQNAVGPMLPYLGFQILKLGIGQNLNQHRDYRNHPDYPNHTMKFGKYRGGSLQMLRDGTWYSHDKENQWLSFDALKAVHQGTPVTSGECYSITLSTPGNLDRLTAQDWGILAKAVSNFFIAFLLREIMIPISCSDSGLEFLHYCIMNSRRFCTEMQSLTSAILVVNVL